MEKTVLMKMGMMITMRRSSINCSIKTMKKSHPIKRLGK
jgi:hypothetical protein